MPPSEARREVLRVREARKYKPSESQDVVLHAIIQLIPWRLQVARAMVTLVDKDLQFIIAESSKTSDIQGLNPPIDPNDNLWLGCQAALEKSDSLCQFTMATPTPSTGYAIFQVSDLSKESRFQHIPAVRDPPHTRFYAGTPLISPQGIRVGTLCVLDPQPHDPLNHDQIQFLGLMAASVVRHLHSETEIQAHLRYTKMSRGLASLISQENAYLRPNDSDERDSDAQSSATRSAHPVANTYTKLFTTAADILRQSLDSDLAILAENFDELQSWGTSEEMRLGLSYSSSKQPFIQDILAYRHPDDIMRTLCQRWPLGKIWIRDDNKNFVGIEDAHLRSTASSLDQRRNSTTSANSLSDELECEWLASWLPKAMQVIFMPLWDLTTSSEPSACFIATQQSFPQYTAEDEVPFIRAFLNSLSVICGHMTMRLADKQKDRLLSSVSHELRSPLHGIIASVEMLSATTLNQTQVDLCESIDVCSQTLFDTMSIVMDHAMVNSFVEGRSKNPFKSNAGPTVHAGSSLHLEATCNIAVLCEEGIDITRTAFSNLTKSTGNQTLGKGPVEIDFRASRANWAFTCTPGIIRRLVMNLVSNSMKYTDAGSILVELTQADTLQQDAVQDATVIVLTVSDTGKGMSTEFMKNGLFVPFSQESSTAPGLGLGLSIVRASVASLGGSIGVDSSQDRGTTVTVTFSAHRPSVLQSADASKHDPAELRLVTQSSGKTYRKFGPSFSETCRHGETLDVYLQGWWLFQAIDDLTTLVDWTFVDERDAQLDLPPSRNYIVLSHDPRIDSLPTSRVQSLRYLKVPFGPKSLSKALRVLGHESHTSTSDAKYSDLSRFRMVLPRRDADSGQIEFNLDQVRSPSQIVQIQAGSPGPLTTASMGVLSAGSPRASHASKRPRDYFTGLQHSHSDTVVATTTTSPATTTRPRTRSTSVLCVDDNSINLRLLKTYCTKLGFNRIVTAEDGLQAVQAVIDSASPGDPPAGSQPFDVIFMDLTMPVCDGFEATKRIRQFEAERRLLNAKPRGQEVEESGLLPTTTADTISSGQVETHSQSEDAATVDVEKDQNDGHKAVTPALAAAPRATIIAITALGSEADQTKAFNVGVDHFVTKPLRFKDLKALLVDLGLLLT